MAVPARPVGGAPTESAWGQVVHDTAVAQDIQSGQVTCVHSAANISAIATITFPRPFASAPVVVLSSTNYNYGAASDGTLPSASGYRAFTKRIDGSAPSASVVVTWIAYGPRA